MGAERDKNMAFEAEVRRIAEAVWGLLPGECQPMHYADDPVVRELDGMARMRDVTHLLMVTTSTRLDKVKDDCKKLNAAENIEKGRASAISKWIVTEKQLDAQHVDHARRNNVQAITFSDFKRRFFDSSKYLRLRNNAAFGSARDPRNNSINLSEDAYIALPMRISFAADDPKRKITGKSISLDDISNRINRGETVVLRAPFGSGKSLTTREIFRILAKKHVANASEPTPFALNLREHWGAEYCDEVLERHARMIGYDPRTDLVIAWRAGMCSLLLDGFDEVAAQAVGRNDNKSFMREARRKALTGVRDFTQKLPPDVGVFICGRDHYFDTDSELASSLGVGGRKFIIVDLGEFNDLNTQEYLKKNGVSNSLPDWLPRKPLLLGYLLKERLLDQILSIDGSKGFGYAWNEFLAQICQREASLDQAVMDALTVRSVLERLAFGVRATASGVGPITGTDLASSYTTETGQPAGEGVLAQLQRLPGLAQRDEHGEARSFVDDDLLAALQGSAFARFVLSAFTADVNAPLSALNDRAVNMASYVLQTQQASIETILTIISQLVGGRSTLRGAAQHAADCLSVVINLSLQDGRSAIDLHDSIIDGASINALELDEISLHNVSFHNCTVRELVIGESTDLGSIRFKSCLVDKISGVSDRRALPAGFISEDSEIDAYDNISTNSAVLKLDISPQLKALITVLRKLYKQAGGGRKLGALSRGINGDVQRYIAPIVDLLKQHDFVTVQSSIVHPIRRQRGRVEEILSSPLISEDVLAVEARRLQ